MSSYNGEPGDAAPAARKAETPADGAVVRRLAAYAIRAATLSALLAWAVVALLEPPHGPGVWLALTLLLSAAGGLAAPAVLRRHDSGGPGPE